jgi:citrate lyase subunit beta-like protein
VTPSKKAEARALVRETLDKPISPNNGERAVRINSVESGLALADLQEVVSCRETPSTITLLIRHTA